MQELLHLHYGPVSSLTETMAALEKGAIAHSLDLNISHDRMLSDYGVLWMLVRCRLTLTRRPVGELSLNTFLRSPNAALSNRDFDLFDAQGLCGSAVQTWVLADANERKLVNLKQIDALWTVPRPQPERTQTLRRLAMPELSGAVSWTVAPEEIDKNGHLNNVQYVRHAEALSPGGALGLEAFFDRECFAGETLRLETGRGDGFFVRGVKENGSESFRMRFFGGLK